MEHLIESLRNIKLAYYSEKICRHSSTARYIVLDTTTQGKQEQVAIHVATVESLR